MKTARSFLVASSLILCAHAFGDMARPPDARAEEPAKTDSLLHRAGDLVDDERFAAAQAVLETLAAIAPENANVLASLGSVYARLGRNEEAFVALERALELDPDLVDARADLGQVALDLGRRERALAELSRVVELQPQSAEAHLDLACAYGSLGRLDEAEAQLAAAGAIAPEHPLLHLNLGQLHRQRHEWEQAIAALVRMREIDSWHRLVDESLRAVTAEARDPLQRRCRRDPADAAAHNALAWCEAYGGEMKNARKEAEKAVRLAPHDAAFLRAAAEFCIQLKKYDEALDLLQRSVAADSTDWAGFAMIAQVELTRERPVEALASLARAPTMEVIVMQDHLGTALSLLERHAEAAAAFRHAMDLGADDMMTHFNLAACYTNLEDYAAAWPEARKAERRGHPRAKALIARLENFSTEPH